jgi:hypothetical protein
MYRPDLHHVAAVRGEGKNIEVRRVRDKGKERAGRGNHFMPATGEGSSGAKVVVGSGFEPEKA